MEQNNSHIATDDLAVMIKEGFDGVDKGFEGVNNRLGVLEQGQEEIKLRLDNVAQRFELVELEKRVKEIEKKMGIMPQMV